MQRRDFLTGMARSGALSLAASRNSRGESQKPGAPQAAGTTKNSSTTRPNILFLSPDQWRYDWMSTNPVLPIRTPNLDRIAKNGILFSNAIVNSPLCAPSRACLATGMRYGKTGVQSNLQDLPIAPKGLLYPFEPLPTFYSALRNDGYHVAACGKMDLAKNSVWWGLDGMWRLPLLGFSRGVNMGCKGDERVGYMINDNRPADPYLTFLQSQGLMKIHLADYDKRFAAKHIYTELYATPLPEDGYLDNWIAKTGLDLIESAPKDKPWFLQVNWGGPHSPMDITARMERDIRGRKMPQPIDGRQYSPEMHERIRQNYTAMCENIDRGIGLYLDKLASTGQLENTLIVFSSDHGDMLGDLGRWGKNVPYQPSACVPLIVSGPGVRAGTTSNALINNIDLTATFLDYGGVSTMKEIDGKSLRPVLEGPTNEHRDHVVSALGAWRMAYDGQYKVVRGFDPSLSNPAEWTVFSQEIQGVPPLVFDLSEDPHEQKNLGPAIPQGAQRLFEAVGDGRS